MSAPRRSAPFGTEAAILEDLRLARDCGGIAKADVQRLRASCLLRHGTENPTPEQLIDTRTWLMGHIQRGAVAFSVLHRGDGVATAAAAAAEAILLASADELRTALAIRQEMVAKYQCFVAPDSLRKRESAALALMAHSAFVDAQMVDTEDLTTIDLFLRVLEPRADLAATSVSAAVWMYSHRAQLDDDEPFARSVRHALWGVAQLGVLPVYGLDLIRVLGSDAPAEKILAHLLQTLVQAPFREEPRDLYDLATATRIEEDADQLYGRLCRTPLLQPLVQRFLLWIGSHNPQTCLYDSNALMVGYCGPHYYVAICAELAEVYEDWVSGDIAKDANIILHDLLNTDHPPAHKPERLDKLTVKRQSN